MKAFLKQYLNNNFKLEKWQIFGITCLVIALTGFFGWIYEFFFYYLNSGMKEFYWRGSNFLPWINIYAVGSIMIVLLTYKLRNNPFLVFIISFLSTGILEFITGYVCFEFFGGLRLWDYNTEILNFGNIYGYVCLRSVLFFGLSSLLLMYCLLPFCIYLSRKMNKKVFLLLSTSLCFLCLFDKLYNFLLAKLFGWPDAISIYSKLGFNFMKY